MKEIILPLFGSIGLGLITMFLITKGASFFADAIIKIIAKCKKHKSPSNENTESNQSIKDLTIEATNDKQYVDEALSDCDNLINIIKTCEKENKLSKEVEIIDEQIHKYRLLMSFDKTMIYDDNLNPQIDFNEYVKKYNYNNLIVEIHTLKELLMIQTFALRFFDYMFPNEGRYTTGRNGICKMEFIYDENMNKYILNIEYFYGTTSVNHNYPILDGYYFGCTVGSQLLVDDLLNMVNNIEHVLDIDDLSNLAVKNHIKGVFTKMKNTLNSKKFPLFKV